MMWPVDELMSESFNMDEVLKVSVAFRNSGLLAKWSLKLYYCKDPAMMRGL
ncbi:hypothetical protein [Sphingobacterium multivorum]|uniref:hypothetical protein n=1 Tax=Sphingobacterium multivorum TaxID=28454 RepID=UPI0028ABBF86|nr:hypothetical protein [Sphingobacterium multivorum]